MTWIVPGPSSPIVSRAIGPHRYGVSGSARDAGVQEAEQESPGTRICP
ncbi:MAG: hypothetical protein MZU91_09025 [Desulfosudis oleivorans]|nr:hypothetical protein [Desulfosudis oleivorans]